MNNAILLNVHFMCRCFESCLYRKLKIYRFKPITRTQRQGVAIVLLRASGFKLDGSVLGLKARLYA